MTRRDIFESIFKHYQARKRRLFFINTMLSNYKNEQVLREDQVDYNFGLKPRDDNPTLGRICKLKERLERLVDIRDLLIEQLDQLEKKILVMRFDYQMDVSEILEALYISESTYYRKIDEIFMKFDIYFDLFEDLFKQDIDNS